MTQSGLFLCRKERLEIATKEEGYFMEKRTAEKIIKKLTDSLQAINEAASLIRDNCSDTERRAHFEPISQAMALLFDELDLILEEHPTLRPENIQDS
jgi:hypothetical protein